MTEMDVKQLTVNEAQELTARIYDDMDKIWKLITRAYLGRADKAMGYDSWDAYCRGEFHASRLKLPRAERHEVVTSMREAGMPIRAIASATGSSVGNVHRALVPGGTPADESDDVIEAELVNDHTRTEEGATTATTQPRKTRTYYDGTRTRMDEHLLHAFVDSVTALHLGIQDIEDIDPAIPGEVVDKCRRELATATKTFRALARLLKEHQS